MGGSVSNATPGAVTRLGPANRTGLARSDQTGSTRMLWAATWMSTEACPIDCPAGHMLRPVLLSSPQAPAQQVREGPIRGGLARIEEPSAAKVVAWQPAVIHVRSARSVRRVEQ